MDPLIRSSSMRAGFRGKPPPTKRDDFGLPRLVIVPTQMDKEWIFCDAPVKDDGEYLDMLQLPSDTRTPRQRLEGAVHACDQINYDAREIGIQCFDDGRWPDKTDLQCWWCLHQFETRPFPCPVSKTKEGVLRIRGVFCGPSCAKAWAFCGGGFDRNSTVDSLINELAHKRGYWPLNKKFYYIPAAPPRECLKMYCGPQGLSIEQFRGLCAAGFDVLILHPPYITEKQIIVAECDRMARISRSGRLIHMDSVNQLMVPAAEFAKRRREGLEIFAGVGTKRLTDFIGNKKQTTPAPVPIPTASTQPTDPVMHTKNGRIKRPLPVTDPLALPPPKKARKTTKSNR